MTIITNYSGNETVTKLQSAFADLADAEKNYRDNLPHFSRFKDLPLEAWLDRIEQAQGNALHLSQIAFTRRELLLAYTAALMRSKAKTRLMKKLRTRLLVVSLEAYETVKNTRLSANVADTIFCLLADVIGWLELEANARYRDVWEHAREIPVDEDEIDSALENAFLEICNYRHEVYSPDPQDQDIPAAYSAEYIDQARFYGNYNIRFMSRRDLGVPCDQFEEFDLSDLRNISSLAEQMRQALRSLRDLYSPIEHSSFSERQYAHDLLHPSGDSRTLQSKLERHCESRKRYQKARVAFAAQVQFIENLRNELARALKAHLARTRDNDGNTAKIQPVNKIAAIRDVRRLTVLNCLEADTLLRDAGKKLLECRVQLRHDRSAGRAKSTIEDYVTDNSKLFTGVKSF